MNKIVVATYPLFAMATTIETIYVEIPVEDATWGQLKQLHKATDVEYKFPENARLEVLTEREQVWRGRIGG